MLLKIDQVNSFDHLGVSVTLRHLAVTEQKLSFIGEVSSEKKFSIRELSLLLSSASRTWCFSCRSQEDLLILDGEVPIKDLDIQATLSLCVEKTQLTWIELKLHSSILDDVKQWSGYFSGKLSELPNLDLKAVSNRALQSAKIVSISKPDDEYVAFCKLATSPEFVVRLAKLRRSGRFPGITTHKDGFILASKLVFRWNILIVQDSNQRLFVFQGVTSCDAIYIPGLNKLIIVCHITIQDIKQCFEILVRNPEFLKITTPRSFLGYLVGHTRPYHAHYDSLLALQNLRETGQLLPQDTLFSKSDEAFIDLGSSLDLPQKHQRKTKNELNKLAETEQGYLLQLGSWFYAFCQSPDDRYLELASNVDLSLRQFASTNSELGCSGALDYLKECQPLLWVGITGQKRRWLEQISGTAHILNTLYEHYPKMGVIFDGWTPPLANSKDHQKEILKDDKVIRSIIKKLHFRKHGRFGITAGLPMLEKIRVGMSIDLFITNYTAGSINVARICKKPGVGHMSRRMMIDKDQHIHHQTRIIDPEYIQDQSDPNTPTGYIDYSIPWQAVYNSLVEILVELPIKPNKTLEQLIVPNNYRLD